MNRLSFILLFSLTALKANAQCTFERHYNYYLGIPPNGPLTKTIKVSDGGFLTVSSMYIDSLNPGQHGYSHMCAIKNDSCGNTIWKYTYSPSIGADVVEASNGDYLITDIGPWQQALENIEVLRIDKNGNVIWDKLYSGNIVSNPNNIIKRKNYNSYIVSGFKQYTGSLITDYGYVIEINDSGQVLKSADFPYVNMDIQKTFEINDTTYLMIASSNDSLFLIQTDTSFNVRWMKKPFVNLLKYFDGFYNACLSYDQKNIAIALVVNGYKFVARIDLEGNLITHNTIPDSYPSLTYIIPTPNNGYIIGSNLLYTDSNFNIIKYQIIYGDQLNSIVLNQDQSITGSGISNVQSSTIGVLCVVKIDSSGNYAHAGINETQLQNTELTIYPNPATNELHIVSIGNEKMNMQFFDITGKQVLPTLSFVKSVNFFTETLNEGMYFVRITDANGAMIKTQKVAVVR